MVEALVTLKAGFTLSGGTSERLMNSTFAVTWDVKDLKLEKHGFAEDSDDISITGIFGNTGTITERNGPFTQPVPNATITVRKNGFIVDRVKTDAEGEYTIFVPSGTYDIEIDGHNYKRSISNYEINDGITEVYCVPIEGDIFERYYDCVSFLDNDDIVDIVYNNNWLVNGEILDPVGKPVSDAQIIVSIEDEVVVYVKTNEEGKYHFMLPIETYDVRILLPKQHVKIANNVTFGGRDGFIPNVVQQLRTVK